MIRDGGHIVDLLTKRAKAKEAATLGKEKERKSKG